MSFAVCIVSAAGGSGSSSLCAALASAFAERGTKVGLLDCQPGCGELSDILGASETCVYNAGDAMKGRCGIEEAVCEPFDGVYLVPAASEEQDCQPGSMRRFGAYFEREEVKRDIIVLDMPKAYGDGARELYSCADMTVICSRAEERQLKRAYKLRRQLQRYSMDVRLVITDFDKKRFSAGDIPDLDKCIDIAGARLLGLVPHDEGFEKALHRGERVVSGEAFEAARRIAGRIAGERIPLPQSFL